MKSIKLSWLALVMLLIFQGCVRYIPSRVELNKPYGADPAIEYVGLDAFYLYDREQRVRLQNLIDKRLAGANNSPSGNKYRIGPGDGLKIEVKNFEEISKDYEVLANGNIQLPFVGPVKVKGLTEEQLHKKIRVMAENYVIEPQVHVEITNYESQKVWVLGQSVASSNNSKNNGNNGSGRAYPLRRPNYSLVELLIETADPRMLSSSGVIYLYPAGALHNTRDNQTALRRTDLSDVNPYCGHGQPGWSNSEDGSNQSCSLYQENMAKVPLVNKYHPHARIQIDLEELFGGLSKAPLHVPLKPGDAIYFPPSSLVQIYGEVVRRGSYQVRGGGFGGRTTNDSGIKPSLFSALAAAQGLTYAADIGNIEIYRELEFGKKVVLSVDFEDLTLRNTQDVRLRDGDIIWVPSKSGRFIEEHSISAINQFLGTGNNIDRSIVSR